jgi:predicted AlkP superfamily pyrophosphatase or phosphodiesterase
VIVFAINPSSVHTVRMRMRPWRRRLVLVSVLLALAAARCASTPARRHLLIVVDGLRPDYVTGDVMPNLTALSKRGVVFTRHHSVYPTVTRVNAASISTGAYPETHGLMGNAVFFPRVNPAKFLDTANRLDLLKVAESEGRLLTASTLGESLRAAGRTMLVVSSGSGGSALLNNHTLSGGAILHYEYTLPATLGEDMKALGPPPAKGASPGALDRYAVDALLNVGLPRVRPTVTVLWLSDLDSTAHEHGIGAPETIAVLRHVDGEIKRIEDGLRAQGLFDSYDIWVTSDHGFSTHTGAADLKSLVQPFTGTLPDGSPRVVTGGGAIYVRDGDAAAVSGIVTALQHTAGVGAIFTRGSQPGSLDGAVPGTLSFRAVRWDHDRAAQILFSPDWTDAANTSGIRGTAASNETAGHGSSSPWDVHNTLIAAGPDLKRGATIDLPTANVDFAPTFLALLNLPRAASMQGRPLEEAFVDAQPAELGPVRTDTHTARAPDGTYTVTATFSIVRAGGREYRYFDSAKVGRTLVVPPRAVLTSASPR